MSNNRLAIIELQAESAATRTDDDTAASLSTELECIRRFDKSMHARSELRTKFCHSTSAANFATRSSSRSVPSSIRRFAATAL